MKRKLARHIGISMVVLSNLFALAALWAVYLIVRDIGWLAGFFAAGLGLSIGRIIGPAPLFAVSASVVHFGYGAAGIWFPLVAYIWALAAIVMQLTIFKGASTLPEYLHRDVD
ncbi:MAG: hypothetical protein EPO25_06390 [Gammaproteobacteria bacterium]|nr:MAG: hypothetical protein EPO25_06390 [Gammaproteobacteria bacterium]